MKQPAIYKIQSAIKPERFYVGSAVNFSKRKATHLSDLRKGKHHSIKLQSHFNKYGESDLVFSILLECPKEQLITREQDFLDALNPYFNISKTAGSNLGFKQSEESNRKRSAKLKGKPKSAEHTQRMIGNEYSKGKTPWNKDIKMSKEFCKSDSDSHIGIYTGEKHPMFGKHHSEKSIQTMRDSWVIRKLAKA